MNYVHESCLVKWLTTHSLHSQNHQRRCELCLQEYKISYEFDTLSNIIKKGFNYAIKDKRRLVRGLLYALYLWIFFKRFIHMIKSVVRVIEQVCVSTYANVTRLSIKKSQQIINASKQAANQ